MHTSNKWGERTAWTAWTAWRRRLVDRSSKQKGNQNVGWPLTVCSFITCYDIVGKYVYAQFFVNVSSRFWSCFPTLPSLRNKLRKVQASPLLYNFLVFILSKYDGMHSFEVQWKSSKKEISTVLQTQVFSATCSILNADQLQQNL